ncbi:hypothetical protein [Streptomyces sp. Ag109_G2-15]|uniref:hypothetical protein n=1 Tax=Streptomyces sp. Ag109_G2-15 TaxID=1938850 RepID=UPI000BDCF70A|nr:hypothetical protein [Streptomyces sp. Ag109_G2-15]SOD82741.1 hypothetical protein SAMN06272765_0693 [Streptomyces sp. Ag109_G2-15]
MNVRKAAVAIGASLALLSGCGGGTGEAPSLDAKQTVATLPDAKSVPGWEVSLEPVAYSLKKALSMGVGRCYGEAPDSCARVRFLGVSAFHQQGKPDLSFIVQTYKDSATAKSAYRAVWKGWKGRVPSSRPVNVGEVGEQRDAVAGLSASMAKDSKGTLVQVRVGSVIMLSMAESVPRIEMADSFLTKFATVFAQRADQVQEGKTPTAGLRGV